MQAQKNNNQSQIKLLIVVAVIFSAFLFSNKMQNTENKTYTITTLNQICNIVNDDNIELLINDFAQWLIYYNEAIKSVREKIPNDTKNLKNTEIAKCEFVWTDDGQNKLTGVILTENETGKTTKIDFKPE